VEVDVALVVLLAAGFLLGYLRGAIRQLIVVGAWLVVFVVSAHVRGPIGDWIASQGPQYSREHVDMLAFLAAFLILFAVAVVIIEIGGTRIHLTKRVSVDEILGGFLALGATLLLIAAVAIALDSYYGAGPGDLPPGTTELDLARQLNQAFDRSAIVGFMHVSLIPGLMALLGPLLPADIRAVYA
jgi:uncharacterized membrane protein required for colicin V production